MLKAKALLTHCITFLLFNNNAITQLKETLDNYERVDSQNIKWSINVNIVEPDFLRRRAFL